MLLLDTRDNPQAIPVGKSLADFQPLQANSQPVYCPACTWGEDIGTDLQQLPPQRFRDTALQPSKQLGRAR